MNIKRKYEKYKKIKKEEARLKEKITYLKKTSKELKQEKKKLHEENNDLLKNNKENQLIRRLQKENKKLNKYVKNNPETVESRRIFNSYTCITIVITFLFLFWVYYICFNMNLTSSYKKFLLPLIITIGSVVYINFPENIIHFIEKYLTKSDLSHVEREDNRSALKGFSNIMFVVLIIGTFIFYDTSPIYKIKINSDEYNLKYEGLGNAKEKEFNKLIKDENYQIIIKEKNKSE
ncbi:hypothetical protein [Staphylococcus epidermidis]|uniref:hypothetical protein n=2 Tax=Staphylococcus epidermidis TaxID=1282 RepID=UPI0034DAC30B